MRGHGTAHYWRLIPALRGCARSDPGHPLAGAALDELLSLLAAVSEQHGPRLILDAEICGLLAGQGFREPLLPGAAAEPVTAIGMLSILGPVHASMLSLERFNA
jgi:hypothetical protein